MPQMYQDTLVVTEQELMDTGKFSSQASLRSHIQRGINSPVKFYSKFRRASKGKPTLFLYDKLPPEVKAIIPDPRRFDHVLEHYYKESTHARKFFHSLDISEKLLHQCILHAEILEAAIALKEARENLRRSMNIQTQDVIKSIADDVKSFNDVLYMRYGIKHKLPTSLRRFRDLINRFSTQIEHHYSYICLISGKIE